MMKNINRAITTEKATVRFVEDLVILPLHLMPV